jgi:post-segregation antitoxin (ccd killing protein)
MRGSLFVVGIAASLVAGCSGSDGGPGGAGPSPTVNSITVSLRDVVLVGTTAAATATATLSNNQTQAVTSGWRSDAPAVASVTDAGTVTGVSNGEASIIAASGGREGAKRIRVAPNYAGNWQGMQIVTACAATGDFEGACDDGGSVIGQPFPIALTARQPGDLSVAGEFTVESQLFPTFNTQVASDGAIAFAGTLTLEGVRGAVSWQMNSTENGRGTGTIREIYSAPGIISGEVTYDSNLSEFTRGAGLSMSAAAQARSRLANLRKRIRTPRR